MALPRRILVFCTPRGSRGKGFQFLTLTILSHQRELQATSRGRPGRQSPVPRYTCCGHTQRARLCQGSTMPQPGLPGAPVWFVPTCVTTWACMVTGSPYAMIWLPLLCSCFRAVTWAIAHSDPPSPSVCLVHILGPCPGSCLLLLNHSPAPKRGDPLPSYDPPWLGCPGGQGSSAVCLQGLAQDEGAGCGS